MINVTDSPPRYKTQVLTDEGRLTVENLVEEDTGTYVCMAVYPIGPVRGEVILRVLSFMEPLKPFLVLLVEVVLVVFLILLCECQGRRKGTTAVPGKTGTSCRNHRVQHSSQGTSMLWALVPLSRIVFSEQLLEGFEWLVNGAKFPSQSKKTKSLGEGLDSKLCAILLNAK